MEESINHSKIEKIIIEIETGDIDDTIALIYALKNPHFDVKAILVTPGSKQQLGCIEQIFNYISYPIELRNKIQIGVEKLDAHSNLSPIYERAYGKYNIYNGEYKLGSDIVIECCLKYPEEIIFVSLGPPKILAQALMKNEEIKIKNLTAQGGFAGVGVVPEEKILDKFKGKVECPTWNLGGSVQSAEYLLKCTRILNRNFISKNVCHNIIYNSVFHKKLKAATEIYKNSFGYYFYDIMNKGYFIHKKERDSRKSINKKIHDILPLMTIINSDVCKFKEVDLYYNRKNASWGSKLMSDTSTFISIDYNPDIYWELLIK